MKSTKFKIILFSSFLIILLFLSGIAIYAAFSTTSVRGDIEVSSATIKATTQFQADNNDFSWEYNKAGDYKEIRISTTNQTASQDEEGFVLHNRYEITSSSDSSLLDAIIVYFNDEVIGTLSEVTDSKVMSIEDKYSFIPLNQVRQDVFKFELHQAAESSIFDNENVSITITSYTENANYSKFIYVHSEEEFKAAVDDINSGLFDINPTVVICNNLVLSSSYTVSNYMPIYINGKTISGSITLNDTTSTDPDALIEVLGEGSISSVTLGANYDVDAAKQLVIDYAKNKLGEGISANSTANIIGPYSFYNPTVTLVSDNITYAAPNIKANSTANEYYNKNAIITVFGTTITFKVYGTKTRILNETLAHLPDTGSTISRDLFLPTYIKDLDSSITWRSSNEDILSSVGKIAKQKVDNVEVKLYADIKINNTEYTKVYTYIVSAHNNEINFYKLVQEISPIVIANIYNDASDAADALYFLPVVDAESDYDYRKSYKSPTNTQLFDYKAFNDIGLENITYSMTDEMKSLYDYITLAPTGLADNNLYLNKITLNNYARINVTGDFGNDETYTTYINISISVGSDTQLLEKAFAQIQDELDQISVLGNILNTRISDGMANEKGDFALSSVYLKDSDYTIEYSGASTIIDSITSNSSTQQYDFTINPEYFNEYETTVAFKATVYYRKGLSGATSKSRTFYVTVPAALHVKDFGTISLYNSLKYQTYLSLPSNERDDTKCGYTKTSTKLVDSNLDYVLLRDIVGDTSYLTDYCNNNDLYLDKISYTNTSQYAKGVKKVELLINSDNFADATDTYAYDFVKLIEWATGNTRQTAGEVVSNTAAISGLTSNKANAADYLNDDEVAVLKACYKYYTSATDSEWEDIYEEVLNVAPGYIYTNPELLNTVIKSLGDNNFIYPSGETFSTLFGKHMEILQRYAVATTDVNANNVAPCQQQYNTKFAWTHTSTNDTTMGISNYTINVDGTGYTANYSIQISDGTWWQRFNYDGSGGGDGVLGGLYARPAFAADKTSYITSAELQIIMMFWLNSCSSKSSNDDKLIEATPDNTQRVISGILTNDAGKYYSKYSISDFAVTGQAIINAFYACMEIPTYFTTDGVSKLVKYFYNNYNYNSSKYELPKYDGTITTTFASAINGNSIPYVTNVDSLKAALSYFTSVEELNIIGTSSLSAFLSENGIFTIYTRASLDNPNINKLIMNYCASEYVNFDLSSISNYDNLTHLDLSNNKGIGSVNELVNVNRGNYTYVDISNIGVEYDYQEFAIDNIATPDCTVWFTNSSGNRDSSNDNTYASVVSDLSDFNKFITLYMYMSNIAYDENGNAITINWRIDEGNNIYSTPISNGGTYPEISSIEEMNQLVSPYYYALESFTYTYNGNSYPFLNKYVYEISFENGNLVKSTVGGPYDKITDISDLSSYGTDIETPEDITDYTPEVLEYTTYTYESSDITNATYESYDDFYTGASTSVTKTVTFNNSYYVSVGGRYLWYGAFRNGDNGVNNNVAANNDLTNYLGGSNGTCVTSTNNATKFFFLTRSQFLSVELGTNQTIDGATTNTVVANENTYYLCFIYNNKLYIAGDDRTESANDYAVAATTDITHGLTVKISNNRFYFSRDTSRRFRKNGAHRLVMHTQNVTTSFSTTTAYEYNATTTYPSEFTVNYKNGTSLHKEGMYSCGYNILKVEGTLTFTDTQLINTDTYTVDDEKFYVYYDGSNTTVTNVYGESVPLKNGTVIQITPTYKYPSVSRKRTYSMTGTIYLWEFWYAETQADLLTNEVTIDGGIISSIVVRYGNVGKLYTEDDMLALLPSNSATTTQISGFDVDWNTVPLESTWELGWYANPYISYVTKASNTSHQLLDNQLDYYNVLSNDGEYIVRYTGTTAQEGIYKESFSTTTTSYTKNYGYNLEINSSNELSWNQYSTYLSDTTTNNMKTILDAANQHFGDNQYGAYYGMYYGYSGTSMYDASLGMYLKQYYVYRIMPNATNSAFEWQEVQKYFAGRTPSEMLYELGTGVSGVGDIYYAEGATAFNTFFPQGWYKVTIDEKTNIVNLVKFNDMSISIQTKYTQLTNQKIHNSSSDYLGYSGTFTTQISALYRVKNSDGTYTDYIKTYKLRFVGSLTT